MLGFTAVSGTGKTTLLAALIPALGARDIRVGIIKQARRDFDVDQPGKDSYRLREAGAAKVMVASARRWALMVETPRQPEASLWRLLEEIGQDDIDLLLVEGFKHEPFPKIELHRTSLGHSLLFRDDDDVVAVATDGPINVDTGKLIVLDLNDVEAMADFICSYAWRR
jgi:molybdopterin molybdotransferase